MSMADIFKARLGWNPSQEPFHTSAKRQGGDCRAIKSGSEFDAPVTSGRPELNTCRECSYEPDHRRTWLTTSTSTPR
jgi:hypothetical protein